MKAISFKNICVYRRIKGILWEAIHQTVEDENDVSCKIKQRLEIFILGVATEGLRLRKF